MQAILTRFHGPTILAAVAIATLASCAPAPPPANLAAQTRAKILEDWQHAKRLCHRAATHRLLQHGTSEEDCAIGLFAQYKETGEWYAPTVSRSGAVSAAKADPAALFSAHATEETGL